MIILYDYIEGTRTPVGRVALIENINSPYPSDIVGLWRLKSGEFYVCKSRHTNEQTEWFAELISEPEAKSIAMKYPDVYEKFFLALPELECEDPNSPVEV